MLGCNNGGGSGFFSKVQRLVGKWIGTRKLLYCLILWNIWNAGTFYPGLFHPYNHLCIFAPVYGLLEYARIFGFEHTFGLGRIFYGDFTPFCVFETQNQTCHLFNCIFELQFWTTVAGPIFGALSRSFCHERFFNNEISSTALLDIQLTLLCVCGSP